MSFPFSIVSGLKLIPWWGWWRNPSMRHASTITMKMCTICWSNQFTKQRFILGSTSEGWITLFRATLKTGIVIDGPQLHRNWSFYMQLQLGLLKGMELQQEIINTNRCCGYAKSVTRPDSCCLKDTASFDQFPSTSTDNQKNCAPTVLIQLNLKI